MANTTTLEWGIKDSTLGDAPAWWGARAILDRRGHKPLLDILWDRVALVADTTLDRQGLVAALDGGCIAALRKAVARDALALDEDEREIERFVADSPKGSVRFFLRARGGYLYIAARLAA